MFKREDFTKEALYPLLFAVLACVSTFFAGNNFIAAHSQHIASAFFTIFSVFFGFIAASLSILFSIQDKRFVKTLKSAGTFSIILKYHIRACLLNFLAIACAFLTTLSDGEFPLFDIVVASKIMISVGVWAFFASIRVVHMLSIVLGLDPEK